MNNNAAETIERTLTNVAVKTIARYEHALARRGLVVSDPEVEVWHADPTHRTSEIRIRFYDRGELEDVFEFHLFREGKQAVTEEEIEQWMDENLRSLAVTRRGSV